MISIEPQPALARTQMPGIFAAELRQQLRDFSLRLLARDARLEPRDHAGVLPIISDLRFRLQRQQHFNRQIAIKIMRRYKVQARRQNADDSMTATIEQRFFADERRIAAEIAA